MEFSELRLRGFSLLVLCHGKASVPNALEVLHLRVVSRRSRVIRRGDKTLQVIGRGLLNAFVESLRNRLVVVKFYLLVLSEASTSKETRDVLPATGRHFVHLVHVVSVTDFPLIHGRLRQILETGLRGISCVVLCHRQAGVPSALEILHLRMVSRRSSLILRGN